MSPDLALPLLKLTAWCALPFALRPLLARCSASSRHLLLTLALAGTLAMPVLLVTAPAWQAAPRNPSRTAWLPWPSPAFEEPVLLRKTSSSIEPDRSQTSSSIEPDRSQTSSSIESDRSQTSSSIEPDRSQTSSSIEPDRSQTSSSIEPFQSPTLMPGYSPGDPSLDAARVATADRVRPRVLTARSTASLLSRFDPNRLGLTWLVWIWLAGAAVMTLRTARAVGRASRIARDASRIDDPRAARALVAARGRLQTAIQPELRQSRRSAVPFAGCGTSPVVVLPESWRLWNDQRLSVVLVHELAHLSRRDTLALAVGRAAAAWCTCSSAGRARNANRPRTTRSCFPDPVPRTMPSTS